MTEAHGADHGRHGMSRSAQLDRVLTELVGQVPEIEAASVVSFDGLAMASALPPGMDEDRVAAMSAALLSLGERAAEGLGRGELSQVYVEGQNGTVFLVSADDEAVLVAVAARGAKVGLMLFEVRRAAAAVADALRVDDIAEARHSDTYDDETYSDPSYADHSETFESADVPAQLHVVATDGWPELGTQGSLAPNGSGNSDAPSWS
jgi:predicted regulator of Ras-like GTPase activity (Roadblock/LC7/MglB family)